MRKKAAPRSKEKELCQITIANMFLSIAGFFWPVLYSITMQVDSAEPETMEGRNSERQYNSDASDT